MYILFVVVSLLEVWTWTFKVVVSANGLGIINFWSGSDVSTVYLKLTKCGLKNIETFEKL